MPHVLDVPPSRHSAGSHASHGQQIYALARAKKLPSLLEPRRQLLKTNTLHIPNLPTRSRHYSALPSSTETLTRHGGQLTVGHLCSQRGLFPAWRPSASLGLGRPKMTPGRRSERCCESGSGCARAHGPLLGRLSADSCHLPLVAALGHRAGRSNH